MLDARTQGGRYKCMEGGSYRRGFCLKGVPGGNAVVTQTSGGIKAVIIVYIGGDSVSTSEHSPCSHCTVRGALIMMLSRCMFIWVFFF